MVGAKFMTGIRRYALIGFVALAGAAVGCGQGAGHQSPESMGELAGFARALERLGARVAPAVTGGAESVPGPTFEIARAEPGARLELRDAPGGRVLAVQKAQTEFGADRTFYVAEHRGAWLGVTSDAAPGNSL